MDNARVVRPLLPMFLPPLLDYHAMTILWLPYVLGKGSRLYRDRQTPKFLKNATVDFALVYCNVCGFRTKWAVLLRCLITWVTRSSTHVTTSASVMDHVPRWGDLMPYITPSKSRHTMANA